MVNRIMTTRSKIVGITRHRADGEEIMQEGALRAIALEEPDIDDAALIIKGDDTVQADETPPWEYTSEGYGYSPPGAWKASVLPSILILAGFVWTGFFAFATWPEIQTGISYDRIVSLISMWSLPTCLIAVSWLLAMRNSRAEASRFGKTALMLRSESDALVVRMRTVNEEIATAREFLAQNARELESIGRLSARRLIEAAEQLRTALADSDVKAKTLEDASNAATSNLEQLRKHLPVVTSAAKDVTNQIGSAGNSAQVQVKSLITALQRVGEAGEAARNSVESMSERAAVASLNIGQVVGESADLLVESVSQAERRSNALADQLSNAALNAEAKLTATSDAMGATLADASARFDGMVSGSHSTLRAHVDSLRQSLDALQMQSVDEDARLSGMIAKVSEHITQSAAHITAVDADATERTAKLAFSVEALVHSTKELNSSLGANHETAQTLVERSERLLLALDTANREIDESLPAALDRIDDRLIKSLAYIDDASTKSASLGEYNEDMLAKITVIQDLMETQKDAVDGLMTSSSEHFTARHEQADALAGALVQTRSLIEEMTHSANEGLVASLLRVRETTKQAAESSKKILDEELASVAERLAEQNKAVLADAVDSQVAVLGDMIQSSVDRSILLSEASTQKIAAQLAQIDEMTGNLEQRLGDVRGGFDGIGDDSFARQMVLLTESLNSTAIDVAKILSNDVTDTAWAAYLKGDRGVFTRRAVRLLDAGEARIIAGHYGDDHEFREHVNRYIHDFEAMMRVLLSTRDGNAIGVTLLSSDVGKLYVALAQAIERLRN
jgi:hypothetical protein